MTAAFALAALLWMSASACAAQKDSQECPRGFIRVATNNIFEPFHCRKADEAVPPFIKMTPTFKAQPCPRGTHAVATPGQLRRYRCVIDAPKSSAEPDALLRTTAGQPFEEKVLDAAAAVKPDISAFKAPTEFLRYALDGAVRFDYPKGWRVTNNWEDDVPTIYVEYDTGRQGKQLTLIISKIVRGQDGHSSLDETIAKEKEYQNAAEATPRKIAGFPARLTYVAKESRTAYVPISDDAYFTLGYSAPEDLFDRFLGTYARLLDSFAVLKARREP